MLSLHTIFYYNTIVMLIVCFIVRIGQKEYYMEVDVKLESKCIKVVLEYVSSFAYLILNLMDEC